jgi:hypothetical protein
MRTAIRLAVLATAGGLASCDSRTPTPTTTAGGPDAEFGGWTWYALKPADPAGGDVSVCAAWGSWKKRLAYVILTDGTASSATDLTSAGGRIRYDVFLTWPAGRKAEVVVETADGLTGTVTHTGRSFDLSRGAVFVVVPGPEGFELRQLERNLSGETADQAGVLKLIRSDPEIIRRFARGDGRK